MTQPQTVPATCVKVPLKAEVGQTYAWAFRGQTDTVEVLSAYPREEGNPCDFLVVRGERQGVFCTDACLITPKEA